MAIVRGHITITAMLGALLASACDGVVSGLGEDRPPLQVLYGRFDADLSAFDAPERLRVGVLWTAVPVFVPYCHDRGPTALDPDRRLTRVSRLACRDPFEVVPGRSGPSAPIDPATGAFSLAISELPGADLMVGTRDNRVAYASIVVFDDRNGNGAIDTEGRCGVGGRGGGSDEMPDLPETIYAASFSTLTEDQLRLVFIEGALDPASFYYPHPDCAELPGAGFSMWHVGSLLDADATCALRSFDDAIVLRPGAEVYTNLACRQSDNEPYHRPPRMFDIDVADFVWECTDDGAIAVIRADCACPGVRTFALLGCYDSVECEEPDWDLRQSVPDVWPCPVPR